MVREYKKKTGREFPEGDIRRAVEDVLNNVGSLRQVADMHNVTKSRLAIYVRKAREQGLENISLRPNFKHRQIFSPEMEQALAAYLLKCSSMFYGLTAKKTRQLAFQFASRNKLLVPESWKIQTMAGEEWFGGFLRRNPTLSIRKPEATSLARMTAFNKTVVGEFFDKLQTVYARHNYESNQVFNLDETGVTTVPAVEKIVGKKGEKQIGQVTSRERGELVTQVGIICANGNALPPVWIFPRVRFDEHRMMSGATQGSMGLVNKSGWMTTDNFIKVLQFFQRNIRCTKGNPVLLILDNHESHLSDDGITFCKENGIEVLTLPPHTSNKLQPLDRSVFGPFKRYFSEAANSWMMAHPNQTLSIYCLAELCSKAWDRAATPENIKSGFRKCGIFPFDRDTFQEYEFLCSSVSDRPVPEPTTSQFEESCLSEKNCRNVATNSNQSADKSAIPSTSNTPGTGIEQSADRSLNNISGFISPDEISPYPKAEPRKLLRKGRKRGKCMIVTDTPEKEELLAKKKALPKKLKEAKRKVLVESESSDEGINENEVTKDSSSEWEEEEDEELAKDIHEVEKGGFIVVKVPGKTPFSGRNFVARVERKLLDGFEVRFFKRMIPSNRFKITEEESCFVTFEEAIAVLPKAIDDTRPRFQNAIYFNADLLEFSLN